jgi:polyvinyl alcohol dehydrogenase (cytochrome)
MKLIAKDMSDMDKRKISEYLTNRTFEDSSSIKPQIKCNNNSHWFDFNEPSLASGWGITNSRNTRFIPEEVSKLSAENVKNLQLKWVFSFPNTNTARSQPAFAGGAVFVGDENGDVYALDAKSGCVHWTFKAESDIRTAITIGGLGDALSDKKNSPVVYFGDSSVNTYAINALTGKLIWKMKIEEHPSARITGSITLQHTSFGDRLYVPVSSLEEGMSVNPNYPCCTFRGSVTALDAESGRLIWKSYSIPIEPREYRKNKKGVAQYGPSGAGIWNSPTIDDRRNRLYVGTGENDSSPTKNGGAVLAIDLKDGTIAWVFQAYPDEAYNASCHDQERISCPEEFRGRYGLDVAASPILLRNKESRDVIVAAQKTGDIFGLDPDNNGTVLWRRRITSSEFNLGVLFGMAAEERTIFATVMDLKRNPQLGRYWGVEELGIYALDGFTGEPIWQAPVSGHCSSKIPCRGYSAAITAIPGVIFAGAKDGYFRAFDSVNGAMLWEFNTAQKFIALNGEVAQGGDIDGPGAVIVNGMVYVNSGYATGNSAIHPGNAFLAFAAGKK